MKRNRELEKRIEELIDGHCKYFPSESHLHLYYIQDKGQLKNDILDLIREETDTIQSCMFYEDGYPGDPD